MVHDSGRGKCVVGEQPHYRVTAAKRGHVGRGVDHHTGGFGAEAFIGNRPYRNDHIVEVEPGGPDLHAYLTGAQFGLRLCR
ncbi:hypothetical protein MYBA111488_24745 [Mycobacterium basiliense]